jgi:hypothetical protein
MDLVTRRRSAHRLLSNTTPLCSRPNHQTLPIAMVGKLQVKDHPVVTIVHTPLACLHKARIPIQRNSINLRNQKHRLASNLANPRPIGW